MCEQDCIWYPMSNVEFSAKRIGQRMYCCRTASCNRNSSIISSEHHVVFCFHVIRIVVCLSDIAKDQLCAFQRIRIAEWCCFLWSIAFYDVCQCIDTGCRYDRFRQFCDHSGIQDDIIRYHFFIYDSFFRLLFRNRYDRVAGCLWTGTAGRRNHHGFYFFLCKWRVIHQITDRIWCILQYARKLRRIHDRTAANSDDQITRISLYKIHNLFHLEICRLRLTVCKDMILHLQLIKFRSQELQKTGCLNSLIWKYDNSAGTFPRNNLFYFLYASFTAIHTGRKLYLITHSYTSCFVSADFFSHIHQKRFVSETSWFCKYKCTALACVQFWQYNSCFEFSDWSQLCFFQLSDTSKQGISSCHKDASLCFSSHQSSCNNSKWIRNPDSGIIKF